MSDTAQIGTTVHQIVCDVLGQTPEELGREEVLAAHGWDSIASLEALAMLESEFEITLDLRSFHSAHTVTRLIDLVASGLTADAHAE